jgi:hypothetical protein
MLKASVVYNKVRYVILWGHSCLWTGILAGIFMAVFVCSLMWNMNVFSQIIFINTVTYLDLQLVDGYHVLMVEHSSGNTWKKKSH